MSQIRILSDSLANRIAAGEVIERPASVVKELVENALDAGATRISVKVTQGGRRLIQVSDDGCGMNREDAMLCIEPHATSKIRDEADIDRISTLGFRGEALPSIASVSRFQLQTRIPAEMSGTEVLIENGALRDVRDCGCPVGTTVRIEHLFAAVPGRRKFLQSPPTEEGHIHECVLMQALGNPEVAFELIMNDREAVRANRAPELGARIAMLLGRDVFSAMIEVDYEEAGIQVSGYIARPGLTRSSRREQRVFVNGRPAAANTIYYGIRDAYHTMVMKGRYPPAVLRIEVDPHRVDVNVHPAKREVRFREARLAGKVVTAAVGRALRELAGELGTRASVPGGVFPGGAFPPLEFGSTIEQQRLPLQTFSPAPSAAPHVPDGADLPSAANPVEAGGEEPCPLPPEGGQGTSPSVATRGEITALDILGRLGDHYLVAQGSNGLVLVDQHAAHERVLFEQLLATARGKPGLQQQLLLPVTIDLPPDDAGLLRTHLERFQTLGFCLEPFGGNTFLITAVPSRFPEENVTGLVRDILDDIREGGAPSSKASDIRIAQAACRHAVKVNDSLNEEIGQLLGDLARAEMPYTCPHGRPVMINITFAELQKRFGRHS